MDVRWHDDQPHILEFETATTSRLCWIEHDVYSCEAPQHIRQVRALHAFGTQNYLMQGQLSLTQPLLPFQTLSRQHRHHISW